MEWVLILLLGLALGLMGGLLLARSRVRGLAAKAESLAEEKRQAATERDVAQAKLDSTTQFFERQLEAQKQQEREKGCAEGGNP